MEARLYNILKSENAITMVNTISESPYKVLHEPFKRSVQFSKAVQF